MGSKTILVVDDSPTILMSLEYILMDDGYSVSTCLNAELAIDSLNFTKKHSVKKFDLMITDFNMSNMNGIALTREVRKMPSYRFMPILLLTTESDKELRLNAKSAGATGWMVKPFKHDELLKTVKQVIHGP